MSSNIENLEQKNADYAATFTQGHLALPPSEKYAVGTSVNIPQLTSNPVPVPYHSALYDNLNLPYT